MQAKRLKFGVLQVHNTRSGDWVHVVKVEINTSHELMSASWIKPRNTKELRGLSI